MVQFLTDNTLGRTWYEMMQGETKLAHLDYLVRRSKRGLSGTRDENSARVRQPTTDEAQPGRSCFPADVCTMPFRAKKDPRDLRILDPACGSGHFLLYTFDLLHHDLRKRRGPMQGLRASPKPAPKALRADFGRAESTLCYVLTIPELILRQRNLHGVDIDPRCAQIAALALWMRAQRALSDFGIKRSSRPRVGGTNVVTAEPMPGDAAQRADFLANLDPKIGPTCSAHLRTNDAGR